MLMAPKAWSGRARDAGRAGSIRVTATCAATIHAPTLDWARSITWTPSMSFGRMGQANRFPAAGQISGRTSCYTREEAVRSRIDSAAAVRRTARFCEPPLNEEAPVIREVLLRWPKHATNV